MVKSKFTPQEKARIVLESINTWLFYFIIHDIFLRDIPSCFRKTDQQGLQIISDAVMRQITKAQKNADHGNHMPVFMPAFPTPQRQLQQAPHTPDSPDKCLCTLI